MSAPDHYWPDPEWDRSINFDILADPYLIEEAPDDGR